MDSQLGAKTSYALSHSVITRTYKRACNHISILLSMRSFKHVEKYSAVLPKAAAPSHVWLFVHISYNSLKI